MYHSQWFSKRDWPSLTRAALFVIWVLFLTGAVPAFIGGTRAWIREMRSRDFDKEAQVRRETLKWVEAKTAEVKRSGRNYSPEMYFRDLWAFHQKQTEGGLGMLFVNDALTQVQDNINHDLFTMEEFRRQADLYEARRLALHPEANQGITSAEMGKFGRGLFSFYLKSILVALLIYLLRMLEDGEGILRSILADKRRFALALVLWPRFIWTYPFSCTINYILAEAELRRIGGLFRRLNEAERSLVRQVAKLPKVEFRTWLLGHRACLGPLYVRGLALGILGAVVCLLFAPVLTRRAEATESTPQAHVLARDGPQVHQLGTDDGGSSNSGPAAVLPDIPDLPTPLASGTIVTPKPKVPRRQGVRLEHIPLSIRLAAVHVRTPQTERTEGDEEVRASRLPNAA